MRAAHGEGPHQLHALLRVVASRSARLDGGALHLRRLAIPTDRRLDVEGRGAARPGEAQSALALRLGALDRRLRVARQLLEAVARGREMRAAHGEGPHQLHALLRVSPPTAAARLARPTSQPARVEHDAVPRERIDQLLFESNGPSHKALPPLALV